MANNTNDNSDLAYADTLWNFKEGEPFTDKCPMFVAELKECLTEGERLILVVVGQLGIVGNGA